MKINSVNNSNNTRFEHAHLESTYSKNKRAIVAGMTALGTAASCAVMAKKGGYSLNPKKMFKNIKKSYLAKVFYDDKQVIPIGIGSSLGGLAGGYMIDTNKDNRKAKRRETLMQIGNISIPITIVDFLSKKCKRFGKVQQACGAIAGIGIGVVVANFIMNKLCNFIFNNKSDSRGVKITDFSAHLDDAILAASYVAPKSAFVHGVARIIPVALMVAGNEVGNKTAKQNPLKR